MFAVFPILREFSDPNKKGRGSIDKNLYFLAADRPSDIVRKVRQQLVAAGIYGNAMEAMLALDTTFWFRSLTHVHHRSHPDSVTR